LREVVGKHPLLHAAAQENAVLSQRLAALAAQSEALADEHHTVRRRLAELERDLRSIEQQLEIAGYSPALAAVLIAERRKLPNLQAYRRNAQQRGNQIADARLQEFQLKERLERSRSDPNAREQDLGEPGPAELEALLAERQALLGKLADTYGNLARQLTALRRDEQQLAEVGQQLTMLLNERLLWTASTTPVGMAWLNQGREASDWLLAPENWAQGGPDLLAAAAEAPVLAASALLGFAGLLGIRRQLRWQAISISKGIGDPHRDSFGHTLAMLLIVVLWALPWPLLLVSTGWLLRTSLQAEHFAAAIGHGLTRLALTVFIVELLRRISAPKGLAETHFHWSEQACSVLHGNLSWIRCFIFPISFIFGMIELQPPDLVSEAPGRLIFMVGNLAVCVFLWRLMHPRHGALGGYLGTHRQGWIWRLRATWFPLVVGSPLALEALVLAGYYYTATDLASRLGFSFYSTVGLLLLYHLMLRWARVAEQRLALARALTKRRAASEARVARQIGEASGEGIPAGLELPQSSIQDISEQTRALLRAAVLVLLAVALWGHWADLAPAGHLLDQIALWHNTV